MNLMPFIILIVMFFLGTNGRNRGVVNYKFTVERIVLTLAIMPSLAMFIKEKLIAYMPELLAAIIGVVFGLLLVFLILTTALGKITKIPEYEYTASDKTLGFFVGTLKGFCILTFFIMLYGISFIDIVAPEVLNINFKNNFINSRVENSIEYYRKSIYSVYKKTSSAGVEDLYAKKGQSNVIDLSGYVKWAQSPFTSRQESDTPVKTEEKK